MDESNVNSRLLKIQSQRAKLRQKLQEIDSNQALAQENIQKRPNTESAYNYQQTMTRLMQRKRKLDLQKLQAQNLRKIQSEYMQRKANQERQREMERVKNEMRMIELDVAMKKAVFDSVKEKVKGQNSDELMRRIMIRGEETSTLTKRDKFDEETLRKEFQQFLSLDQNKALQVKYDIYSLNEKRMEIFEAKQTAVMREILLKEFSSQKEHPDIDVMNLDRQQLQLKIRQYGYNLQQYLNPIPKEEIIGSIDRISNDARRRIQSNKQTIQAQRSQLAEYQQKISKLKRSLYEQHSSQNINLIKSILNTIVNNGVLAYQKRISNKSSQQHKQAYKSLQKQYHQILQISDDVGLADMIVEGLLQEIHKEMAMEAVEQVYSLHEFAHRKSEEAFGWLFNNGTLLQGKVGKRPEDIPVELVFDQRDGQDNEGDKLKKNNYLKKFQQNLSNIFDVDQLTVQLINDVELLEAEEEYFENVLVGFRNQKSVKDSPFLIVYDRQLFTISNKTIFRVSHESKILKLKGNDSASNLNIESVRKMNKNWLILDKDNIYLYTPWSTEVLPSQIGDRISNKGGKAFTVEYYPIRTILGSPSSILIGYEKGQILKYNYNTDRISHQQTNLTYYQPILPSVKSGDQPPFPLDYKNPIQVINKKIQAGKRNTIHQWREFFDHHTVPIISLCFYMVNVFVSVDANLKCAIWQYDVREGIKSYDPIYTFELVCSFKVYNEAENPQFKSIFPSPETKDSERDLYVKWMQTESFLKKQIYNNPKKQTAYFMSPVFQQFEQQRGQQNPERPLWKITYDDRQQKITKILQSFYSVSDGTIQGRTAKVWKDLLFVMCERDHTIRRDLKTIKLYGWNIQQRKMRTIGIEFDMFKNQSSVDFVILDNFLVNVSLPLVGVVSSGRILLFSLVSGQLLRNLSDERYIDPSGGLKIQDYSSYFFNSIVSGPSFFAASTNRSVMEINLNDRNTNQSQTKINAMLEAAKKRYINLM